MLLGNSNKLCPPKESQILIFSLLWSGFRDGAQNSLEHTPINSLLERKVIKQNLFQKCHFVGAGKSKQTKTKQKITRCLLIAETASTTPLCSLAVVTTVSSGSPNFGTFLIRQGLRCGYEFSPILPKSLGPYSILLIHPFLGSCPESISIGQN